MHCTMKGRFNFSIKKQQACTLDDNNHRRITCTFIIINIRLILCSMSFNCYQLLLHV